MATAFAHDPYEFNGKMFWYGQDISVLVNKGLLFYFKDFRFHAMTQDETVEFSAKSVTELLLQVEAPAVKNVVKKRIQPHI